MVTSSAMTLPSIPADSAFSSTEYARIIEKFIHDRSKPKPTKWEEQERWDMTVVHSMFLSLLHRVYASADHAVDSGDLGNYLGFACVAFAQLHEHHHFEESSYFPFIEKSIGDNDHRLTKNIEEHHSFENQLVQAWVYVQLCRDQLSPSPAPSPAGVRPTPENIAGASMVYETSQLNPAGGFSAGKLRNHMDSWIMSLARHLEGEIVTLEPDWLVKMGKEKHDEMKANLQAHLKENDPAWFLISGIACIPKSVGTQLIPLPMIVRKVLVPFMWAGKYKGYWKYTEYPENIRFLSI